MQNKLLPSGIRHYREHFMGKTVLSNCQLLCRDCNRRKGAK